MELGLRQEEVAAALGVSRFAVARYESGERRVDAELVPALAVILQVGAEYLASLLEGARRGGVRSVRERAPLTPVSCDVEAMLARLPSFKRLHDEVRATIGEGQYEELKANFLRQTPFELALGFLALFDAGALAWTSLLEAGSRVLYTGEDKRAYQGHLLRLAISWRRGRERIVLFPQVPLLVPKTDKRYRVDYLAVHETHGKAATNVVVELDGEPHPMQRARDEARAEDLKLPIARFDNQAVTSQNFLAWVMRSIREKADAARISDGARAEHRWHVTLETVTKGKRSAPT